MGEVADRVGEFVTAYSGDLREESLDGQRLVVCGIVVGSRTIITRARSTMAAVTLEDLQGSLEVVVFPRLYEQTLGTWAEGAILVVAGKVDHRGEEVSLLADLVMPWDDAAALGPEAFARQVAAGDRGGGPRRRQPVGPGQPAGSGAPSASGERWAPAPTPSGNGHANGSGSGAAAPSDGNGAPGPRLGLGRRPEIPYVSPLRGGRIPDAGPLELRVSAPVAVVAPAAPDSGVATDLPPIAPPEPVSTHDDADPASAAADRDIEPALPDEARARFATAAASPTVPLDATGTGQVLQVRFTRGPSVQIVPAMEMLRQVIRERPGETQVVVHVPGPAGAMLPMPLRTRVAYDAELLAEIHRRIGEGIVDLALG